MNKLTRDRIIVIVWSVLWVWLLFTKGFSYWATWVVLVIGLALTAKELISPTDYNKE